jgi:dihydroorotate dehydrogenase
LQAVRKAGPPRPLLVCVPPDLDCADVERYMGRAVELGIGGVIVDSGIRTGSAGRLTGLPVQHPALQTVQHLRQRWGSGLVIIGSGGIHEPEHALQFLQMGANLVQIDSGLVYGGPGLPKRTNDALLCAGIPAALAPNEAGTTASPPPEMSWFWAFLLGISMFGGGGLALLIASTRVVLHYDESFVGMTRAQLEAANDKLLLFMAHDRVTLAGTMIAVGVLYVQLSLFGIRRGLHWARVTVLSSAFAGFGSFFLFLGFGYFDPFHAFVSAILFQFLLLALHSRQAQPLEPVAPNLRDDWRWRWSLWGQFLFVVQGVVYIVAGLVIATVGITTVFVHEDLEFMETTAEALAKVSPRLLPLIAHDRASFGGMLIAVGLAVLLPALWGFRRGERWLWWALLAAGTAGYAAAIGVHLAVGYTNLWHLAPAFAGAAVFGLAQGLSYPYLCQADPWHEERWKSYREAT